MLRKISGPERDKATGEGQGNRRGTRQQERDKATGQGQNNRGGKRQQERDKATRERRRLLIEEIYGQYCTNLWSVLYQFMVSTVPIQSV